MLRMALPLLLALVAAVPAGAGDAKVEDLAKNLEAKDARVRGDALLALRRLGPEAAPAVKGLVKALKHADPLTREQAADLLGVHPRTLDRWTRRGRLRAIDLGGTVRIPLAEANRVSRIPPWTRLD